MRGETRWTPCVMCMYGMDACVARATARREMQDIIFRCVRKCAAVCCRTARMYLANYRNSYSSLPVVDCCRRGDEHRPALIPPLLW